MSPKAESFLAILIFVLGGVSAILLSSHFELGWIPFIGIYVGVVSGLYFVCFFVPRLALSNGASPNEKSGS